jgi:inositol-hexakisphosphate 5-kinase
LDSLWAPSVDQPQLSGRDRIFATANYLPSQSPTSFADDPPSDPANTRTNGGQASNRQRLVAGAYGGTVTESKSSHADVARPSIHSPLPAHPSHEKQKGFGNKRSVHSSTHIRPPTHTLHTSRPRGIKPMGNTAELDGTVIHESPLGSPIQFSSSSARIHFDDDASVDAEEEAERARYRSWREGKAALTRGHGSKPRRSKSGDNSKVDRKIQATLPKADSQPFNTRSRKSSQYLGLFKEKDAAEDQKRRESRAKEKATTKSKRRLVTESQVPPETAVHARDIKHVRRGSAPATNIRGTFQALGLGGPKSRHELVPILIRKSQPNLQSQVPLEKRVVAKASDHPVRSLDLAFPRKSWLDDEEVGQANSPDPHPSPHLAQLRRDRGSASYQGARQNSLSDQSAVGTLGMDEDEESDLEQISSALYFPHRQVRREVSSQSVLARRPSLIRTRSVMSSTDAPEVDDEILDQATQNPNEVEISLESQDESQLWHGDLPASTAAEESPPEYGSAPIFDASSSVSEYGSFDDSAASTGYDSSVSDDTAGTRTAASRHQMLTDRRHRPRAPVGAVELKPFKHQVGGHSTVYRFSRRAVCKQLNNRENVFYETVERYHPELLDFMPRYAHSSAS